MKKTYIFACITIFLWSTVATVAKLLLDSYNKFQVLWISSLFAFLFLLLVNIFTGNIKKLREYKTKDIITSVLIGLPGTFFYYVFYYTGTALMPASQAFIINYLWPIMSVVFASIILKEKMSLRKAIAIGLSFAGVVIVMGGGAGENSSSSLTGALCCVLGAISYGLFTSLNQKHRYDKRISMMINYFVTFVLTSIINGVSGNLFIPVFPELLGFMWNGMFAIAVANTLWMLALESGKTAKISNLAYITPFISLIWTSLILKEDIRLTSVMGLVVIVAGIFIQLSDGKKADKC